MGRKKGRHFSSLSYDVFTLKLGICFPLGNVIQVGLNPNNLQFVPFIHHVSSKYVFEKSVLILTDIFGQAISAVYKSHFKQPL